MTDWQSAPWLQHVWQQLADAQARHAHAIAIEARAGLGAEAMLKDYVARRLCERPAETLDGVACGHCHSCRWLASGQHPDLRLIRPAALELKPPDLEVQLEGEDPEEKSSGRKLSNEILIDQIRPLSAFLQVGSHRAGARIVWVEPAQRLNRSAANALLKMLEEPGQGALWILLTEQLSSLLPTIRSRCICLKVSPPEAGMARGMLEALMHRQNKDASPGDARAAAQISLALGLSHHAPWAAQQRLLDPVLQAQQAWLQTLAETPQGWFSTLARQWTDHVPEHWFELLEHWAIDLLQASHRLEPLYFTDYSEAALNRVKRLKSSDCFALIDRLFAMKANLRHPLNPRLHAESALLLYADFCGETL